MRAWELRSFDPQSLTLPEGPSPVPAPGEVLVDITAIALNYRDLAIARGQDAPSAFARPASGEQHGKICIEPGGRA